MKEQLTVFKNESFGEIRTVTVNNEPYFVGKDVAEALGYTDVNKAIAMHVDVDDKKLNDKTSPSFGQRGATLINESGLYALVLSSKLPSAKKFKNWVTKEVLPTIRKTGGYVNDDELFINKYLPFADSQTRILFKTTLETVNRQNELIEQQRKEINYKGEVIIGLVKDITLADKRQILNRLVRHSGANYKTRWGILYREFDNKYHINTSTQLENYNLTHKPKCTGRLDYVDRVLNKIPELYEIAAKLFESDVKKLVDEMYQAIG